ncbi:MAG: hypothetical protein ACR2RL_09710, partial [Gammaproteobacteria bacterium]
VLHFRALESREVLGRNHPSHLRGECSQAMVGLGQASAERGDAMPQEYPTVGSSNRGERRYDLPGGGKRMVMPSRGVEHTIVNGELRTPGESWSALRPVDCFVPERSIR